jgi:hypothetical protein
MNNKPLYPDVPQDPAETTADLFKRHNVNINGGLILSRLLIFGVIAWCVIMGGIGYVAGHFIFKVW